MKKTLIVIFIILVGSIYSINNEELQKDNKDLVEFISINISNARISESLTVDGCDNDRYDKCFSAETGELLAINCDPSSFWDTCGD